MESSSSSSRHHRPTHLFFCFPSRRRRPSRLRSSGSLKGAQSPTPFKKPSDPVEPSSPKVTCIGQVRVKTRRRRKHMTPSSTTKKRKRRSWVGLSGICGAVKKALKPEMKCFERRTKKWRTHVCVCPSCACSCSCGFEEKEVERGMELGLARRRERRDVDLVADELERTGGVLGFERRREKEEEEDEVGKFGSCPASASGSVPPKNALLLMRCRSDPARVSALENRFFRNPPVVEIEEEEVERKVFDLGLGLGSSSCGAEKEEVKVRSFVGDSSKDSILGNGSMSDSFAAVGNGSSQLPPPPPVVEEVKAEENEKKKNVREEEEVKKKKLPSEKDEKRKSTSRRSVSIEKEHLPRSTSHRESGRRSSFSSETDARRTSFSTEKRRWSFSSEKESRSAAPVAGGVAKVKKTEEEDEKKLPDCLLLMMYEPKLSMEVSKETWVCSADFARWQSQRRRRNAGGKEKPPAEEVKKCGEDKGLDTNECGGEVKETVTVEPKLATTMVPFVLTRCKSEPTRLVSGGETILSPEVYFWKTGPRLIGAAGIGF